MLGLVAAQAAVALAAVPAVVLAAPPVAATNQRAPGHRGPLLSSIATRTG